MIMNTRDKEITDQRRLNHFDLKSNSTCNRYAIPRGSFPWLLTDNGCYVDIICLQSENPVAYKLASEFIKRTASSLEPYLQMVRWLILRHCNI